MVRSATLISAAVFVVAAAASLLPVAASQDVEVPSADDLDVDELRQRVEASLARTSVPGAALALVQDGEVVWAEGFGVADPRTGRPMRADTLVQAGSLSKSVTAWAVLHLAGQGAIDLDAPVEGQVDGWSLPGAPYDTAGVTPRRLLTHTSGLPFSIDATPRSPASFRSEQVDPEAFTLVQEPGEGFVYSNPGYALLALLVEEATGEQFASVLRTRVLEPLGMHDSTFAPDAQQLARAAPGHTLDAAPVDPAWPSPLGASGLHTTAIDLARFVAAAYEGDRPAGRGVLSPSEVEQLHRPGAPTAGLPHRLMTDAAASGHFVEFLGDVHLIVNAGEEEGWIGGFATVPATGQGIVILTNSRRGYPLLIEELGAWAAANGLDRPGLVRVHDRLRAAAWVVLALLMGGSVGLFVGTVRRGARPTGSTPVPVRGPSRRSRRRRIALGSAAGVLLVGWWGVAFAVLRAFLPVMAPWIGAAVTLTAALLIVRAVTPGPTTAAGSVRDASSVERSAP